MPKLETMAKPETMTKPEIRNPKFEANPNVEARTKLNQCFAEAERELSRREALPCLRRRFLPACRPCSNVPASRDGSRSAGYFRMAKAETFTSDFEFASDFECRVSNFALASDFGFRTSNFLP